MILLHNVGPRINSNYNTPEEILRCSEPLSFDGIYRNVWLHREILKPKLPGAILFYMGNYVGKDNSFDTGQYLEEYCNWNELMDLVVNYGCKLGFHTWSHKPLNALSNEEVMKEITPPFPCHYFAYPGGVVDSRVASLVQEAGYKEAWSVTQGDGSQFQRRRRYLNW